MSQHENDDLPAGIRAALKAGRIVDDRRQGDERREDEPRRESDSGPRISISWGVAVQVVAWVVGMFVLYNTMTGRLTTLETNRGNDIQRMERIESKLDRLLERPSK